MYEQSLNKYEVKSGEYCTNVEDILETPETIKAYIPKLMPNISLGESAIDNLKYTVNPNIFVNGSSCKVVGIETIMTGQNYVTLKPYGNEYPNFRSKAENRGGVYIVPKHNTFILEVQYDDIRSMFFTGKE